MPDCSKNKAKLDGIICAAVPPVDVDLPINLPPLDRHCDRVLSTGCISVTVFGTTGEGPPFASAAKIDAMEALVGARAARLPGSSRHDARAH